MQELLEEIENERKERKKKGTRMQIEDVEDTAEESLAKGDNSSVNAESKVGTKVAQTAPKTNEKVARRMKIQEVESDDGECEEVVINGHASEREKSKTKDSSKDIWNDQEVASETQIQKNTGQSNPPKEVLVSEKLNVETADNTKTPETGGKTDKNETRDSQTDAGRQSPVAAELSEISTDSVSVETSQEQQETAPIQRPVFYTKDLPEKCTSVKEEATTLFKSGQYGEASQKYSKMIESLQGL